MVKMGVLRRLVGMVFGSHRINDSRLYQHYLKLRYPEYYARKLREDSFYKQLISQVGNSLVFDIGANGGGKAVIFAKHAQRVVCVEPSPGAVLVLNQRFANMPAVTVVNKGAGPREGSLPFHFFGDDDCYNTFSTKWVNVLARRDDQGRPFKESQSVIDVDVTTLDLLIDQFGIPSYLKIDVEGYECEVLKGLTREISIISIECNLPDFESETMDCLARLDEIQGGAVFNYCTTEPPSKFGSDRWITRSEMEGVVRDRSHRFLEIYSRSAKSFVGRWPTLGE